MGKPKEKETPAQRFIRLVQLTAMHCSEIMVLEAPTQYRCGISETVYTITIKPSRLGDKVWDQVWIALESDEGDGTLCGNRCGGRETLAGLYADELLKAARDVA